MNLKQQFKQWLDTNPRKEIRDVELVNIANNYAIAFYEWRSTTPIKNIDQYTNAEAMEIYNQQNNLKQ